MPTLIDLNVQHLKEGLTMFQPKRKFLVASIMLAIAGWLTAATMASSVGALKLRAANAEKDAETWKRQAGKAYTALLVAKASTDGKTAGVVVPMGARVDCDMNTQVINGRALNKCSDGTIYPPHDF